jgi:hypothetical protein
MNAHQQILDNASSIAGYRHASFAKSTDTLVVLVNSAEQGIDHELPWTLICEEHNAIMQFETRAQARSWMSAPEQWCEDCQEAHYRPEEKTA